MTKYWYEQKKFIEPSVTSIPKYLNLAAQSPTLYEITTDTQIKVSKINYC